MLASGRLPGRGRRSCACRWLLPAGRNRPLPDGANYSVLPRPADTVDDRRQGDAQRLPAVAERSHGQGSAAQQDPVTRYHRGAPSTPAYSTLEPKLLEAPGAEPGGVRGWGMTLDLPTLALVPVRGWRLTPAPGPVPVCVGRSGGRTGATCRCRRRRRCDPGQRVWVLIGGRRGTRRCLTVPYLGRSLRVTACQGCDERRLEDASAGPRGCGGNLAS